MRIDSPKVSNLTFQSGSAVSDSAFTGSFSGSFTGVGNFTGLTADSVEYANILNRPAGLVSGSSAQARSQIGSVIGTDVQAYHENLSDISNLNPTDSTFIVGAGSSFVLESGNTVRASLGLGSLATLNTNSTLGSVNLSTNSTYSFPNLTDLPTLFSSSDQVTGIGNSQLSNSSITIDSTAVSLGGSVTTLQLGSTNSTALAGNTTTITSAQSTKLSNITITQAVDLDTLESNVTTNNAKVTNVSTNLSKTVSGTGFSINSSDGDNVALTLADTSNWGLMSDEMYDKLDGIEAGATADQSNAEIRAAVEAASDSNVFTDADHTKLNGIEDGATADQDLSSYQLKPSEGAFANGDKTKLDGIEASATADQSNAEIRAAVEAASDSNVFTDADHTKLNNIEANATADQSNAEIRAAVEAASDSNVFTDDDHSKLGSIEDGATADQSNAEIVAAVVASTSISNSNKGTIRSNIGVDAAGTDNSTDVSLGGSYDYITISGQAITRNQINLSTDVTGTLPVSNMAATALTTVQTAADQSAHLALTAQEGDVVVRSDENKTYMHNGGTAGTMADYTLLATPTDAVTSVNGNTGVVTVTENVTTNLGISGTTGARTITSSDGTNAVIPVATDSVSGVMSAADHTRLTGIEDGATADQSNAEIRAAVEAASDSNVFTDADHTKLNAISGTNTGDQDLSSYQLQPSEGAFENGDKTKLDGIESNATADQTAAEIKAAVEAASDSNVFTDDDHSKLDNIEANATADQTAAQIRTLVGTGNSNFVPAAGSAGTFLAHDGVYRTPSYTTNTDTNTNQLTTWTLRDDDNDDVTIGQGKFIKFVSATGASGTNITGAGTTGDPYIVTITSPDTDTDTNTQRGIHDTPVDGATTTSISSNWAFDNVKTAVPSGAVFTDTNTQATRGTLGIDTDDNVAFNGLMVGNALNSTANTIRCEGDIVAYYSSDEQFKDNIVTLDGALDKVKAIRGVRFDWNDKQDVHEGHDIGVVAQEVEAVLPELVHHREYNDSKAVDYVKLTAVLVEAVKELSAKVDELEGKCNC